MENLSENLISSLSHLEMAKEIIERNYKNLEKENNYNTLKVEYD